MPWKRKMAPIAALATKKRDTSKIIHRFDTQPQKILTTLGIFIVPLRTLLTKKTDTRVTGERKLAFQTIKLGWFKSSRSKF